MSQFMSNNSIINFNDSTLEVCFLSFFGEIRKRIYDLRSFGLFTDQEKRKISKG